MSICIGSSPCHNGRRDAGVTLIELAISIMLGSAILYATVMLYSPLVGRWSNAASFQRTRLAVSSPLDGIGQEIRRAKAVYADPAQCYLACLVNRTTGNRVLFYLSGTTLYRKSEAPGTAVACSGGTTFATGLEPSQVQSSQIRDLVTVKLGAKGPDVPVYALLGSFFPVPEERVDLVYEGFECATLVPKSWTLAGSTIAYWQVTQSANAIGRYYLRQTIPSWYPGGETATAEIPLRLARVSGAHVDFSYRTNGTMDAGELLTVTYFDGNAWNEVFRADFRQLITTFRKVTIDLSGFPPSDAARLSFNGTLISSSDHWIIDEITISGN